MSHHFHPADPLHARLARSVAREIVRGDLDAGSAIPSSERLAAATGVSRTVAREALQALAGAGMVTVHHGKRTVVNPIGEWRLLDGIVQAAVLEENPCGDLAAHLFETRATLETTAVRLCAERADDELLARICTASDEMRTYLEAADGSFAPIERLVVDDLRFHALIAEGAGNVVLQQLARDVRIELVPTWALDDLTPADLREVAAAHRALAAALRLRDADAAEELMRRHMRRARETTLLRSRAHADPR